ncbi:MAG TPA: O-antigen ligase family protein [Acidobacteriaceae bacterium]
MPTQVDLRLGDEIFFNTNQIGNLCAISIFFAQYLSRQNEGSWKFPIGFLAITLIRSLSKTTLTAFIVSEGLLLIMDRSISRRTKLLTVAGFLLIVAAFWGLLEAYYQNYISGGDSAASLTGRTGIWVYVASEIAEKPWLGHGFDSMWKVIPPFGPDQFEARHAENEVLQQLYAYGVAGLVLLAGTYVSLYRTVRKLSDKSIRILFLCFLLFMLVRGLAEAEPFDLLLPLWCIVLIAALVSSKDTLMELPFESGAGALAGEIT